MFAGSKQSYLLNLLRRGANTFGRSPDVRHWLAPETAIASSGSPNTYAPSADLPASVTLAASGDRSADSTDEPERRVAAAGGPQDSRIEAVHAPRGLTINTAGAALSDSSAKHARHDPEPDRESFVATEANKRTANARQPESPSATKETGFVEWTTYRAMQPQPEKKEKSLPEERLAERSNETASEWEANSEMAVDSFPPESEARGTLRGTAIREHPKFSSQPRHANAESAASRQENRRPYKLDAERVSNTPGESSFQGLAGVLPLPRYDLATKLGQSANPAKKNIASSLAEIRLEADSEPNQAKQSGSDEPLVPPNSEINLRTSTIGKAAVGRGAPLLTPAQTHRLHTPEALRGKDVKAFERAAPRLTINRLEVRIINQASASKESTVSIPRPPPPVRGSDFLARHYLGRFDLSP